MQEKKKIGSGSRITTREEKIRMARKFSLMSNAFMSVALNDIPACQHVLRILTGIKDLKILEVRTQYTVSKIISHDACLDVLAEDSTGKLYNIEIQRTDNNIDHARRTRFYASMIDSEFLMKGKDYDQLPEVYLFYISTDDLWGIGKTVYHVIKQFAGTGFEHNDGIHVIYVNAEIDDGTEIAELMKYFKTADPQDDSQGELSKRVHFLKDEKGGNDVMCEITDMMIQEGILRGIEIGEKQGKYKNAVRVVENAMNRLDLSLEEACALAEISIEEYKREAMENADVI